MSNLNDDQQEREAHDGFLTFKNPIVYGLIGTALVFFIYAWLAVSRSCQKGVCQSNLKHFLASSPNEIGDTLAGIAGILAFLWIIITVFLQSKELRIARREYEKMADAQTGQLALLKEQGKIFEDEQRQRDEIRAKELLEQKLKTLRNLIAEHGDNVQWKRTEQSSPHFYIPSTLKLFDSSSSVSDMNLEAYFASQSKSVHRKLRTLSALLSSGDLVELPDREVMVPFLTVFDDIWRLEKRLSEDQVERLDTISFRKMRTEVKNSLVAKYWAEKLQDQTP